MDKLVDFLDTYYLEANVDSILHFRFNLRFKIEVSKKSPNLSKDEVHSMKFLKSVY